MSDLRSEKLRARLADPEWRKQHGKLSAQEEAARTEDMAARYKSGETLQSIGDSYDLTRERVRQILSKAGVTRKDGGAHVAGLVNAAQREAQRALKRLQRDQKRLALLDRVIDARRSGTTWVEISRDIGWASTGRGTGLPGYISYLLKKFNRTALEPVVFANHPAALPEARQCLTRYWDRNRATGEAST